MGAGLCTKPVGGITAVAVVPAGAAACGSPADIAAAAVELPLVEGLSSYDETVDSSDGIVRIEHRLTIAVPAEFAASEIEMPTLRRWASAGTFARVDTLAGESLAVGWSERFGSEQPLRLTGIEWSTGKDAHTRPVAILTLRSIDTSPAAKIQNSNPQNSR